MKKIILVLILTFVSILKVNAYTLESVSLPYYVKLNDEIVNVKKVYVKETGEVVFNTSLSYDLDNVYTMYDEENTPNYKKVYSKIVMFKNMSYYGYLTDKSDLNYFITQVVIWKYIFNNKLSIVDEFGNSIDTYDKLVISLYEEASTHTLKNSFLNYDYETNLGETTIFEYSSNTIVILDNPEVDGLNIETIDRKVYITNYKVGEYSLTFYKNYIEAFYSYSDGTYTYFQNLGGPQNLNFTIDYKVSGSKITINEIYEGINGLYGDAVINSSYEVYNSNNEYLGSILKDSYLYVEYNNNYILKDASSNEGFMISADTLFNVEEDDYVVNVTKYVVSKNISINVLDNYTYYVYLKSNNELYATIDKNTNVITLPFGTYYISGDDYYYEFSVFDDLDVVFDIVTKEEIIGETPTTLEGTNNLEEVKNIEEESIENEVEEIENPQTGDNIFLYIKLILFIIASISLCFVMALI